MENLLATLHGSTAPSFSEFEQLLSGSCSFLVLPWLLLSFLSLNTTVNRPQPRFTFHIQMHPGWLLSQSIASSLSLMSLLFQWSLFSSSFSAPVIYMIMLPLLPLFPPIYWKKKKAFPSLSASAPPIPQNLSTENSQNIFTVSLINPRKEMRMSHFLGASIVYRGVSTVAATTGKLQTPYTLHTHSTHFLECVITL